MGAVAARDRPPHRQAQDRSPGERVRLPALPPQRDRPCDESLFLNSQGEPWTYNALRLRWYRLRNRLALDPRFTLYCLRHWFVTVALESGEGEAVVGELAGHVDRDAIDSYKKLRNGPLHQAASRISRTIGRVGIDIPLPEEPK